MDDLPESVKEHVRDMAEKEITLIQTTPQTKATTYLVTLFRELEHLRPNVCGALAAGAQVATTLVLLRIGGYDEYAAEDSPTCKSIVFSRIRSWTRTICLS